MPEWHGTFADRIRRNGSFMLPPWWASIDSELSGLLDNTIKGIEVAEVFSADAVAEYLYGGTDQEHWGPEDFPCVAPPFPVTFIEWCRPSRIVSEENGLVDPHVVAGHTGVLVAARERHDGEPGWDLVGVPLYDIDRLDPLAKILGRTGTLWPGVYLYVQLAPDGSIEWFNEPYAIVPEGVRESAGQDWATAAMSASWPAFLALTFANCKNVPRRTVEPPVKLARKDAKLGKPPRRAYHVLDIGPMKHTLRHEGGLGVAHESMQKALHVCRGHFKTYTGDAPLFGRVTGTWWWPMHVRGSEDAGIVEKDYRVHEQA